MDATLLAYLSLGFGLGMVHALDAGHGIAVTTLASRRPGLRECLGFASSAPSPSSAACLAYS